MRDITRGQNLPPIISVKIAGQKRSKTNFLRIPGSYARLVSDTKENRTFIIFFLLLLRLLFHYTVIYTHI